MDESTEVAKEESVDVLCAIGFMTTDEGDMMRDSNPFVEMVKNCGCEGTSRVGV
jgi:hypothetical protein